MANSDFAASMTKERDRLTAMKADASNRKAAIDAEVADIDRQLKAHAAFEAALHGKTAPTAKAAGTRNGSRQEGILAALKDNTDGLSRGELLDKLGLKGNKSGEQSVSNALGTMTKANKIGKNGGKYVLA